MYLRILKKDLKRKKTMNCILLLFVILSAMFASSSVNNIVTVMNGLDYYFVKAGISDYTVIKMGDDDSLDMILDNEPSVTDYSKEKTITATSENFKRNGEKLSDFSTGSFIMPIDNAKLNYFDRYDNIITEVEPGKAYISGSVAKKKILEEGDTFQIIMGDTELTLEFAGIAKDVFFGSEFMGNPRFILNAGDYNKLCSDNSPYTMMYYINTDDIPALENILADVDIMFDADKEMLRVTYVMNMIVAGMLLVVSVCLILVSFVVLRFTIGFTIAEEFREIGVMKAVGMKNSSIRGLYLVKYFGIAITGAVIGYFASVPFGNMLLASVSENMVLGNENSILTGILCSGAVVGIIMLFCWGCTGKIKKLSPIDAVRSGQTGERFRKRSLMHLGKSRLGVTGFLSLNDILSSPKQYGIVTAVFAICTLLVMILANTANTLSSERLMFLFGITKSDAYYAGDASDLVDVMVGTKTLEDILSNVEKVLEENNMPGNVHIETMYQLPVTFGDKKINVMFQQCKDTKASEYTYSKGTAPQYGNEIALTTLVAEKLGADIGDTVRMTINGTEDDYIITALFQSFNQLGESGRLHESVLLPDTDISSAMAYQIDFDDAPDSKDIDSRIEKLKDIFNNENVYNAKDYVNDCTGAAYIVNGVKNLVLIISVIIIIMISVLTERSFITKEKSEIALMKAVGFRSSSVIAQHTIRFLAVSVIASVTAILTCTPLTKLLIDPIFAIMGAVGGVSYEIKPLEIFAVYPLVIIASTTAGTFITAIYTRTIKASDTSDIE